MSEKILIIDDEADIRDVLSDIFSDEGYTVFKAAHSEQAFMLIEKEKPDLVVLDIWLENSDLDGMGILKTLRKSGDVLETMPVLMISGHGNIEMAVSAMKMGAFDFIEKPFKIDHILMTVRRALEQRLLKQENSSLRHQIAHQESGGKDYRSRSAAFQSILKDIQETASHSEARVLITGEPGSGKNRLAGMIYKLSPRRIRRLHILNGEQCEPGRLESLFANPEFKDDTVLIRHIEAMPRAGQMVMLKELSDQTAPRPRLICTGSTDLKNQVESHQFSSALYDRIAVTHYDIPPLQERSEDIPDLVAMFARHTAQAMKQPVPVFGSDALQRLESRIWRGNVRELKACIEWICINRILAGKAGHPVTPADLNGFLPEADAAATALRDDDAGAGDDGNSLDDLWLDLPLREARENFEKVYLASLMDRFQGNISRIAAHIDMERTALHRKLKQLNVRYTAAKPLNEAGPAMTLQQDREPVTTAKASAL